MTRHKMSFQRKPGRVDGMDRTSGWRSSGRWRMRPSRRFEGPACPVHLTIVGLLVRGVKCGEGLFPSNAVPPHACPSQGSSCPAGGHAAGQLLRLALERRTNAERGIQMLRLRHWFRLPQRRRKKVRSAAGRLRNPHPVVSGDVERGAGAKIESYGGGGLCRAAAILVFKFSANCFPLNCDS